MRIMNRGGFVIEGAFAIVFLVAAATLAVFTLTPAKHLINIGGDGGQKTTQTQSYKETMEPYTENGQPVKVKLSDGSEGLIFKRVVTNATLDETIQPKVPFWKKLLNLGWWWIGLTVAGMFFAPLGFVMNTINGKGKAAAQLLAAQVKDKYENMIAETRKVVVSVDGGLEVFDKAISAANAAADTARAMAAGTTDPKLLENYNGIAATQLAVAKALTDTKNSFLAALSKKQDESTKLLVGQLRHGTGS